MLALRPNVALCLLLVVAVAAARAAQDAEERGVAVETRFVEPLNEGALRNGLQPLTSGDEAWQA